MDKKLEQSVEVKGNPGDTLPGPETALGGASRRRFTRNAVAGSAVILSLGNRAAWGGNPANGIGNNCISHNTMVSYAAASLGPADQGLSTIEKVDAYRQQYVDDENLVEVVRANPNSDESNPLYCAEQPEVQCAPNADVPEGHKQLDSDSTWINKKTLVPLCDQSNP